VPDLSGSRDAFSISACTLTSRSLSSDSDRQIVAELLRECTEKAIGSVFAIIDGVAGEVPGVFEIAEIDGDERKVINPQNSEMLHDLFSDICEVEQVRE
jgi:hypothetical protein